MNCKQGDMAIVVSPRSAANVGLIVEVLRLVPSGSNLLGDGVIWNNIEPEGVPSWEVRSSGRKCHASNKKNPVGFHGLFRDSALLPVSGLDLGDELEATRPASRFYPLSKALSEKALDRIVADVVQNCNID